ncbi:hypothetical protein TKK_0007420 [Trichogramma kaykai]
MEPSDTVYSAVRIKKEHIDEWPTENDGGNIIDSAPDDENQLFGYRPNGSMLREYNVNRKNEFDDLHVEFECKDVKLISNLIVNKKTNDYSQYPSQNMKYSYDCNIENRIKIETVDSVKKEMDLNFDCELGEQRGNLKTNISAMHVRTQNPCSTREKTFLREDHLKSHINLKQHVNKVHKSVRHTCNTCGNTFTQKGHLKKHIDSVHNGVKHACDICGKKFSRKGNLKIHIGSMHNGITYSCDICEEKLSSNSNLYRHIHSRHNGVKCKKFKHPSGLHKHVKSSHDITHSCETCGKTFRQRANLKAHIDMTHRSERIDK